MTSASLPEQVVRALTSRKLKLATAESLTGGDLASAIVDIPGASKCFNGGVVAYSDLAKRSVLEVEWTLLLSNTSVDKEVAYQMALGVMDKFDANCAISTTGVAGPETIGQHPVGLTYICAITPKNRRVQEFIFQGTREEIRAQATKAALTMLLDAL